MKPISLFNYIIISLLPLFLCLTAAQGQEPKETIVLLERAGDDLSFAASQMLVDQDSGGELIFLTPRDGSLSEEQWSRSVSFTFPVSETKSVTTTPRTVSMSAQGNWTHTGGLVEDPSGSFVLATDGTLLYGTVNSNGRSYIIQPVASGVFMSKELTALMGECGTQPPSNMQPSIPPRSKDAGQAPANPRSPNPIPDDGSEIDLMVVFTDDVRRGAMPGGSEWQQRAATYLAIDTMISQTNGIYGNSGVYPRLRLVDRIEIDYNESGNGETDLNAIQAGTAPFTNVATRRDNYRADVVVLVVEGPIVGGTGNNLNGIAFLMVNEVAGFNTDAFFVTLRVAATGAFTFAHELGHVQGARHDRINGPGCVPPTPMCCAEGGAAVFHYSWGWQYTVLIGPPPTPQVPQVRRTVMVRNCQNGIRQDRFSNPNINDLSVATGAPIQIGNPPADNPNAAHNAETLNNTTDTVALFRQSRLTDIYVDASNTGDETGSQADPFNTFEEGINHTILDGTLHLSGGNYVVSDTLDLDPNDNVITIDRRITLVAENGTAAKITR